MRVAPWEECGDRPVWLADGRVTGEPIPPNNSERSNAPAHPGLWRRRARNALLRGRRLPAGVGVYCSDLASAPKVVRWIVAAKSLDEGLRGRPLSVVPSNLPPLPVDAPGGSIGIVAKHLARKPVCPNAPAGPPMPIKLTTQLRRKWSPMHGAGTSVNGNRRPFGRPLAIRVAGNQTSVVIQADGDLWGGMLSRRAAAGGHVKRPKRMPTPGYAR